jgi:transposase
VEVATPRRRPPSRSLHMTTTAVSTAAGPILAIDLGKYKCVACVYRSATDHTFHAIDTSRSEVERLITRTRPAVVVIEACSLAGWVHDLCGELGVRCKVANTATEAWKYKHAKRKTDRDDALRLAQLFALGQLPKVVVPAKATREWRALIAHRQALVARRVAAQNRIRSILVGQGPSADPRSCGGDCWSWP